MNDAGKLLDRLTLEQKIGQMFMIGFPGYELPDAVAQFIQERNIGFVDIFARNISSVEQATSLMNSIHALAEVTPMIFTDQEGGVVCQFGELASTFVTPMGMAATGNPALAELSAEILAKDLDLIGVDGFIAPTVDVNYEPDNPIIGLRAFSDDVETVIEFGDAFIRGVEQAGLAPMLKHFPGHGGSRLDSHLILPTLESSAEFFRSCDLEPFRRLADKVSFVMTAHVANQDIDPSGLPATFSEVFLSGILRRDFGFPGVVITDCLEMDVIKNNFSVEEIVERSMAAGADVMLFSHTLELQKKAYETLVKRVERGQISEDRINESVARILAAKERYGLLTDRRMRDVEKAGKKVRSARWLEDFVSRHSIAVLRDRARKIPLSRKTRVGIIEWHKTRSTVQIREPLHTSYLEKHARKVFKHVDVLILPLQTPDFSTVKTFLKTYDEIIVAPFSRTVELERIQGDVIRELLKIRDDLIVVATGNPYDIRQFPNAKTYIATFGFRDCQIKALFDVLLGEFKPVGRLPVSIKGIFPRWHRCECDA